MGYHKFQKKILAASLAAAIYPTITLGQDSSTESDAPAAIETVLVQARRIERNLQDTPVAITALTPDSLERRQITGTNDLGKVTPNLEFTNNAPLAGNNASSQVFIRGIGQVDASASVDPGVGLYIDDVYMGQSVGGSMELRDIKAVEVLRGPQGTLFGRNTIGGAVLITTVQPGEEFGGTAKLGIGSDSLSEFFVAADMPLSDNFLTRLSFGSKQQDGYVTRAVDGSDLGDTDNYVITAKANYTPSDELEFKFSFDYSKADENGAPLVFAASTESATFQRVASSDAGCPGFDGVWNSIPEVPMIDDARCANDFWAAGEFQNNGTAPLQSTLENQGFSLNIAYELNENTTLKSITSQRELEWRGVRDADNTPFTILHTDYSSKGEQFSQEFQLLYSGDQTNVVAGLYYFTEEYKDTLFVELNTPAPGLQEDSDNNEIDNENIAAFTQLSYDFNETLSGTLGIRHTEETKRSRPDQFNYANPDVKYLPVEWYEVDFSETTISADMSYKFNDSSMGYISYSEGFKGGGFNSHFNRPQTDEDLENFHQFDEETAETWEAGYKAEFLDNTLRFNTSVFTTDYTGLQFVFRVGVAPYLLNAGSATIKGAEMELTWLPSDNWIIESSLGYIDDSINSVSTDFEALGALTSITTANTLPYTPELTGNLGIGYTFNRDSWSASPRIDITHRDETYFDTANTVEIAQNDAVTTVDLFVSLDLTSSDWRFTAGVKNATDELYPIAGNSSLSTGSGYAEIAYARQRQYFIRANYDF